MSRLSKLCWLLVNVLIVVVVASGTSYAEQYKVLGNKDFYVTGYLQEKVEAGLHDAAFQENGLYQLNGATKGGQALLTRAYLENQLLWSDSLEFRLSLRYEFDDMNKFRNSSTWENGVGLTWDKFSDSYDYPGDDEIDDIIREGTVAYFSKYLSVRAGKQQLGWGEADGLRLMDAINPLDLRRNYILGEFDEMRVPLWLLKADVTPEFNFGSSLGFTNLDLEMSWIPDPDSAGNKLALGPRTGGPWAFPLPDVPLPLTQLNALEDQYPDWDFRDHSFAVRLKGLLAGTYFTVNGFYGWSKSFVLDKSGNAAGNAGFITDPGFVGNVADAFDTPIFGGAFGPTYGLELTLNKRVWRQKFIGFTASREIPMQSMARAIGQKTSPVVRVEALFEKDAEFNIGIQNKATTIFSDWVWVNNIEKRDMYRYLIGLDWNLHFDFINPGDDVWVSAQFSQNRIVGDLKSDVLSAPNPAFGYAGGEPQRLQCAPYFWFPEKTETYTTLLLSTAYLNTKLTPSILYVHDWTYDSYTVKAKINYNLTDDWHFETGYYFIGGQKEQQFGLFRDLDTIYGLVKFQF